MHMFSFDIIYAKKLTRARASSRGIVLIYTPVNSVWSFLLSIYYVPDTT